MAVRRHLLAQHFRRLHFFARAVQQARGHIRDWLREEPAFAVRRSQRLLLLRFPEDDCPGRGCPRSRVRVACELSCAKMKWSKTNSRGRSCVESGREKPIQGNSSGKKEGRLALL